MTRSIHSSSVRNSIHCWHVRYATVHSSIDRLSEMPSSCQKSRSSMHILPVISVLSLSLPFGWIKTMSFLVLSIHFTKAHKIEIIYCHFNLWFSHITWRRTQMAHRNRTSNVYPWTDMACELSDGNKTNEKKKNNNTAHAICVASLNENKITLCSNKKITCAAWFCWYVLIVDDAVVIFAIVTDIV